MANRDDMSFSKAFADARREMGGGKTFTWRGNRYTTDLAEETPRRADRSTTEIARSASAAIESARPQMNPRRGMTESPRPQANPRRSDVATSVSTPSITAEPISRNRRDPQDIPPSIRRVIAGSPDEAARMQAERIARRGAEKRVPGRAIIEAIRNFLSGEGPTDPSVIVREGVAPRPTTAAPRRNTGSAGRAAGMARGGMVKSGNTDRRGNGMFYDSKSPRGYK